MATATPLKSTGKGQKFTMAVYVYPDSIIVHEVTVDRGKHDLTFGPRVTFTGSQARRQFLRRIEQALDDAGAPT